MRTPYHQFIILNKPLRSVLEELDQLSVEELDLLKETVDTLIEHVEHIKSQRQ